MSCEECKRAYESLSVQRPFDKKKSKKARPPCRKCKPVLLPGNYAAVNIYHITSDQIIPVGMDGRSIALRHDSIWANIRGFKEKYFIVNETEVFEKVLYIYRKVFSERLEKEKSKE